MLIIFLLHVPFLNADPNTLITYGRDAFTDEGLYAAQVRNFINHNNLTLYESDALIKTPLLGLLQFSWLSIIGISLVKARLLTLFFVFITVFITTQLNKSYTLLMAILMACVYTMQPIFNYTHYSMAEVNSATLILCSIIFLTEAILNSNIKYSVIAAILLSCSWWLKIQFIYVVPAMLMAILILFVFRLIKIRKLNIATTKPLIAFSITILFFVTIFFVGWKMPHSKFFDYVMTDQTNDRWVPQNELYEYLDKMYEYYFSNEIFKPTVQLFYVASVIGLGLLLFSNNKKYSLLLLFAIFWFVAELHKLKMFYLPVRYLVSLFLSGGFIFAIVSHELFSYRTTNQYLKNSCFIMAIFAIIFLLYNNALNYKNQYTTRTFNIKELNDYFSMYNFEKRPVIGAWAPSLTWKSSALTLPVWSNYFDINEIFLKHSPKVIITETDEADSGQAYLLNKINVEANADSVLYKKIDNWNIKIVWLK